MEQKQTPSLWKRARNKLLEGNFIATSLYETIVVLTLLLVLRDHPPRDLLIILYVVGTLVGLRGAEIFSMLIAKKIHHRQWIAYEEQLSLGKEFLSMSLALVPIAYFFMAWLTLIPTSLAYRLAVYTAVSILFVYGFLASHLASRPLLHSVLFGLASGAFALSMVFLKSLVH